MINISEAESRVVLMVLVSLAVAALVVLTVLLTVLQCAKIRRGRAGTRRAKRSEATGDSGEDSDYSSYDGEEEEETRMGDTRSDTSSVQVSQCSRIAEAVMNHFDDNEASYSEPPASTADPEAASERWVCVSREVNVPAPRPRGREADPPATGPGPDHIPEAGARTGPQTSA